MDALFEGVIYTQPDAFIPGSNITTNYNYLYDPLCKCGLTLEELESAVEKLEVISVELDERDDAQLIFESLNSTGLKLNEADKIRNFLLMSLMPAQQEEYYNKYWNEIEKLTKPDGQNSYDPTMFVRDYLTAQTRRIPNLDSLYFEFKDYCKTAEAKQTTRCELLSDMLRYAKVYKEVVKAATDNKELNRKLTQIGYMGTTVHMPFVMKFILFARENGFSYEQMWEVFDLLEGFYARRIVAGKPANALSRLFASLHNETLKLASARSSEEETPLNGEMYIDALKYHLLKRQGFGEFPLDQQVEEELKTRDIYHMNRPQQRFLLERLNNGNSRERVDVVGQLVSKDLSIEHIMPQTLSAKWKTDLGPDFATVHEKYLHTLANLTLTAYNSPYSNQPFSVKKEGWTDEKGNHIVGLKESAYKLSEGLGDYEKWTEAEILDRQKKLIRRFLEIWPMPETKFAPREKQADTVSLEEENNQLTGRTLQGFSLNGEHYDGGSWKDMLVKVCQLVYEGNAAGVEILCGRSDNVQFSDTAQRGYTQFAPGCLVYTASSTNAKMYALRLLFDACDLAQSDLVFELAPDNEEN